MKKLRQKLRIKTLKRNLRRKIKKKSFWIEGLTLYISIFITTLFVQMIILQIDQIILFICLLKSLLGAFVGTSIFMIIRQYAFTFIKKYRLEIIIYTICSMPYSEIIGIYLYKRDVQLMISMIKWYAIAYFVMGIVIKYINRIRTNKHYL